MKLTPGEIAQEINYLAKLAGLSCFDFRHEIIEQTTQITVPLVVAGLINATLEIIDVTTPATPTIESTVPVGLLSGNDDCLYVTGNTAFTLGDDDKLYVIDITNKATPVILASPACHRAGSGFYRMVKVGNFLVLIRSNNVPLQKNTLEVFDISNLATPTSVATYTLTTDFATAQLAGSILMNGTTAIICGDNGSPSFSACMGFYDFSALPVVTQIGVALTDGAGTELDLVDVQGNSALTYASIVGPDELRWYDISTPGTPVLKGALAVPSNVAIYSQIAAGVSYGITLFAADKKIYAFDVSDPTVAPTLLGSSAVVTNNNFSIRAGLDSTGQKVYLATRHNPGVPRNRAVQVYDAAAPAALTLLGEVIYSIGAGNTQLQLAYG